MKKKKEQTSKKKVILSREEKLRRKLGSKAHILAKKALREGIIIKEPCSKCGNPRAIMHHETPHEPLAITWLCNSCHIRRHNEIIKDCGGSSSTDLGDYFKLFYHPDPAKQYKYSMTDELRDKYRYERASSWIELRDRLMYDESRVAQELYENAVKWLKKLFNIDSPPKDTMRSFDPCI
jgi:hypothetical protein